MRGYGWGMDYALKNINYSLVRVLYIKRPVDLVSTFRKKRIEKTIQRKLLLGNAASKKVDRGPREIVFITFNAIKPRG